MSLQEQTVTPEMSPEANVAGLLAAVGNHEAKSTLMGMMLTDEYYGRMGLARLIEESQGGSPSTNWNNHVAQAYVEHSFVPIGLVARVEYGDVLRFALTDRGNEVGKAVAGHMLELSAAHPETSLRRLLSMTTSSAAEGGRTPYARFLFYETLVEAGGSVESTTLLNGAEMPATTVENRLREMATDGMINFQILGSEGAPRTVINPNATGPLPTRGYVKELTLVDEIINSKLPGEQITMKKVYTELIDNHGLVDSKLLYASVIKRLSVLRTRGAIAGDERAKSSEIRMVSIADDKQVAVLDLVSVVRDMHDPTPEFIKSGKEKLYEVLRDKQTVRTLLEKAAANSPQKGTLPKERRITLVVQALDELRGPADPQDIQAHIGNVKITEASSQKLLRVMEKDGRVKRHDRVGRQLTKWALV